MVSKMSDSEAFNIENNPEQLVEKLREEKKKNFVGFATATAKNIASAFPYVDKVVKLYEDYEEYSNNKEINRLVQFFYGINYQDNPNVLIALGPEYAEQIIDCVMKDTESDKLEYYQNLVVNINSENYSKEQRQAFASILRSLTFQDIELAHKYYIYGEYDLVGYEYRFNQLETIHEPTDGQLLRNTNSLVFNGLIYNPNNRESKKGYYKNTDTLNQFVRLIFDENELKAESIGEKEKERFDVIINSGINVGDCFDFLETELKVKGLAVHRCNSLMLDENNLIAGLYVNAIKYDEYYHIGYSDSIEFGKYYDSPKALGSEKIPLVNHNEELSSLAEQILKALSE